MTADDLRDMVLRETLRLAVPMHMSELRGLPADTLTSIATKAATVIGSYGDDLQFGGQHCRDAFNQLARGLAAAALSAWGGVTWQGLHWCTRPACPGPDAPHPEPTTWHQLLEPRPVQTVPLPRDGAA